MTTSEHRIGAQSSNPYVGFRPFFARDALYFFGRTLQTRQLLDLLREQRYVPVLGSSGSGKSSLVLAGVIPTLLGGFMVETRDKWVVIKTRPGDAPLENFVGALYKALSESLRDGRVASDAAVEALVERIRSEGAAPVVEELRSRLSEHHNVLVLADQFEEIFAFRAASGSEESDPPGVVINESQAAERVRRRSDAQAYVSLLFSLAQTDEIDSYVISTMRTDFLGDCDRFSGLPELINRAGYLVPRMTRQQLRESIEGPARLRQVRVAPRLVDYVLNDIGDRSDMLPILQHAMHRSWEEWEKAGRVGPLDQAHLQRAGGLQRALAQEADRLIEPFDPAMVGRVFKRLTRADMQERRVRRPARLSELLAVAGTTPDKVKELLTKLSEEGTNFLYASVDGDEDDPRYDISHESLIRQWERLRHWVDEERELVKWYTELCERAARLRDLNELDELSILARRRLQKQFEESAVNAEWAKRYEDALPAKWVDVQAYIRANTRRRARARVALSISGVVVVAAFASLLSLLNNVIVSSENARSLERIEQLTTLDPTYATTLAAILDDETLASREGLRVTDALESQHIAVGEFEGAQMFSPMGDGEFVAIARDGEIGVYRTERQQRRVAVLNIKDDSVAAIAALRDSTLVVSIASGVVVRWHPFARGQIDTLLKTNVSMDSIRVLAGDRMIALYKDFGDLHLRSVDNSAGASFSLIMNAMAPHPFDSTRLVASVLNEGGPGGTLVEIRRRKSQWMVDTLYSSKSDDFLSVTFAHDGESVMVFPYFGDTFVLDLSKRPKRTPIPVSGVSSAETGFVDQNFLVTTYDGRVQFSDPLAHQETDIVTRHADGTLAKLVPDHSLVLSTDSDGDVRVSRVGEHDMSVSLRGQRSAVSVTRIEATARTLFVLNDIGALRIWAVDAVDSVIRTMESDPVVFPPQIAAETGELLRVVYGGSLWMGSKRLPLPVMVSGDSISSAVAVSDLGEIAAACSSVHCWMWDVTSGRSWPVRSVVPPIERAAFTSDTRWLFIEDSSHTVSQLSVSDGKVVANFTVDSAALWALSPDGEFVSYLSGGVTKLARVDHPTAEASTLPTKSPRRIAWAPSGRRLLVLGDSIAEVFHWESVGGPPLRTASTTNVPVGKLAGLALSASGAWFASAKESSRSVSVSSLSAKDGPVRPVEFTVRSDVRDLQFLPWTDDVVVLTSNGDVQTVGWNEDVTNAPSRWSLLWRSVLRSTPLRALAYEPRRSATARRTFRASVTNQASLIRDRSVTVIGSRSKRLTSLNMAVGGIPISRSWVLDGEVRIQALRQRRPLCIDTQTSIDEGLPESYSANFGCGRDSIVSSAATHR